MRIVLHTSVMTVSALTCAGCTSGNGSTPSEAGALSDVGSGSRDAAYGTPQDCEEAGGRCVVGPALGCVAEGPANTCNCNPGCNPGGAICCIAFADAASSDATPIDAPGCTTDDPLGALTDCTEPVDGGIGGWPSTWMAALLMACPPSASSLVKSCTGGLNVWQMSGIDTQAFGYYSATTGNLVAFVNVGAGGVAPFCEGPNPPPCVSCIEDGTLCPGLIDGGGNDSGSLHDSGTTDARPPGD